MVKRWFNKFTIKLIPVLLFCLASQPAWSAGEFRNLILDLDDSTNLAISGLTDTTFLTLADPDSVIFRTFRRVTGTATALLDSSKVTSTLRTGVAEKAVRGSDGTNVGEYFAVILAYKQGKLVKSKTVEWTVTSKGLNEINKALSDSSGVIVATNNDKTGYRLSATGVDDVWDEPQSGHITAGSFGKRLDKDVSAVDDNPWDNSVRSLTDTANIGGKIASDASEKTYNIFNWGAYTKPDTIARYVWSYSNPITLTDTIPKVFAVNAGASNPDTVAAHVWTWSTRTLTSGAGTGSNQVTITVKNSADSTVINGVQVQVLNQPQSATEGLLTSTSLGQAVFALNSGVYKVRLFKPGYVFTVPESVTVSGNTSSTLYGSAFNPGSPPSAALCRVYGYVKDINNLPVVGAKIEALNKTVPLKYQSAVISPYYKTTVTDTNGYWYLDLFPNSVLTPSDSKYRFNIHVPSGSVLRIETTVPNQTSWELSF